MKNNNFNWNKTILSIIGLLSVYLFISYNLTQAQYNNITFAAQLFGLFKPGSTSLENLLRTDSNGNLGVNLQETDTIDAQLDINGSIKIRTGATTPGQVLTAVDNTGLASWQDATGGSGGSSLKAASFDITFDVYNDSSETITINLNDNTTTQNNATINNLTSTNNFASDQPLFVTYGITYNNLVKARLNAEATPIINLSYPDNTANPSQPLGTRVQFSLTANPDYVGNTSYTPPYGQFKIRVSVLQVGGGTTTVGPPPTTYLSTPTITTSFPSSAMLTNGRVEALRFTVTAANTGDIEWGKIKFRVELNNATLTASTDSFQTIYLNRLGYSSDIYLTRAVLSSTGGNGEIILDIPERIAAGSAETYSLYITVASSGAATESASITTTLFPDDTGPNNPDTFTVQTGRFNTSFVWSDRGSSFRLVNPVPHSRSTDDWYNGFGLSHIINSISLAK